MATWFFATDLHGRTGRWETLWRLIAEERPTVLLLGGDLLPHAMDLSWQSAEDEVCFVTDYLAPGFRRLRDALGDAYPAVLLILGNDDPRAVEDALAEGESEGLWRHIHGTSAAPGGVTVYGYACIPPSPFQLKDWERYDVSRFVDPGSISPEEGMRTAGPRGREIRHTTIADELDALTGDADLSRAVLLTHCPPYGSDLDRADLDGRKVDGVPLDVHIGSIALQRFIADRQPRLTLHGHVHESTRLTGRWRQEFGATVSCNGAHDGPELCLIRLDPEWPLDATRELVQRSDSGSS